MIKILVYQTPEEAKQQLKKYERDNREAFERFAKSEGREDCSKESRTQRYFFVAELAAHVDDGPGRYYFESVHHPFLGFTELCDDVPSLVQRVKKAVKHQTPKNIETILYTVENHDMENQEMKKTAEESRKIAENLPLDKTYCADKKELDEFLQALEKIEGLEVRGLNEQEREEFIRLYKGK